MAITRTKTISAITIHFATEDLYDLEGNLLMTKGTMKRPFVEWKEQLEEDGVPLKDYRGKRIQATEEDVDTERDISGEALKVVRGLKKIIADRSST